MSQKKEDKRKGHEKILEEIIVKIFPKMGNEITTKSKKHRVPNREKPKAKHHKTLINQTNKEQMQRANIKSSKGETTNNTQMDSHKDNS